MLSTYQIFFTVAFIACVTIGGIFYPIEGHPKVTYKAFFLKVGASAIFLLNGALAYLNSSHNKYGKLVIVALVGGIIGDALLSFEPFLNGKNKKRDNIICMVIGAAFFFGGHIAYTLAFIRELMVKEAFNVYVFVGAWVLFIAAGITVKTVLKVSLGNLSIPILIYTICLTAMGAMSISLAVFGLKGNIIHQIIMLVAPIFFIISDATLGLKFGDTVRFGKKKIKFLTLITYYIAQMLFGYSITFLG